MDHSYLRAANTVPAKKYRRLSIRDIAAVRIHLHTVYSFRHTRYAERPAKQYTYPAAYSRRRQQLPPHQFYPYAFCAAKHSAVYTLPTPRKAGWRHAHCAHNLACGTLPAQAPLRPRIPRHGRWRDAGLCFAGAVLKIKDLLLLEFIFLKIEAIHFVSPVILVSCWIAIWPLVCCAAKCYYWKVNKTKEE